jgi:hypothetical protein
MARAILASLPDVMGSVFLAACHATSDSIV